MRLSCFNVRGFTLIEMVAVMLLLAVLAAGIGSFIKLGSQIYVDSSTRTELIASGRFVVERLNRELRTAVPNSVRINSNGGSITCLEFTPSVISTSYIDIPVAPEAASDEVTIARLFNNSLFSDNLRVAVYPTSASDIYSASSKVFDIENGSGLVTNGNQQTITLDNAVQFAADSPTNRLYLIDNPVSYCLNSGEIYRHTGHGYDANDLPDNAGVLMGQFISANSSFTLSAATQYRNATVLIVIELEDNNETFTFSNEVQMPNVP